MGPIGEKQENTPKVDFKYGVKRTWKFKAPTHRPQSFYANSS